MGSVIGTAASSASSAVANAILKPFKDLFSKTCEDECGAWDGVCYMEHACGGSLLRLGSSMLLLSMVLLFVYLLLWKTGLIKCLVKCACKLSWKACRGSCKALGGACGFLWHSLANTPRVYRGRRRDADVEMGDLSWSGSASDWSGSVRARRRSLPSSSSSVRERRMERVHQSLHARRQISKVEHAYAARRSHGERSLHHHHHHRAPGSSMRTEAYSSVRVRHGSPRHERAIVLHDRQR